MRSRNDSQSVTLTNSGLPPRVVAVLRRLLDLTHAELFPRIDSMLDLLDSSLFRDAEKSRNPSEQLDLLRASQVLREKRSAFAPELFRKLEEQLASIRSKPQDVQTSATDSSAEPMSLALEDSPKVDMHAQLRELATPLEGASSLPLYLMGQRFGVLAASPAFTNAELPLSPQQLLEVAAATSQSVFGERIPLQQLLRLFAQHVLTHYANYLEKIGATIERAGILPGLSFVPVLPAKSAHTATATPTSTAAIEENQSLPHTDSSTRATTAPHVFLPVGLAPAGFGSNSSSHTHTTAKQPLSWFEQPSTEGLSTLQSGTPDFCQLQQLLSAHRFASRTSLPQPPLSCASPSHTQIEELLAQLAGQSLPSLQDWRKALQKQIQIHYGETVGLSRENNDSIELLSLLLEKIDQEIHEKSLAHELLQRLHRPLLHAVTGGHDFFENPQDPARQLLNTIAEYSDEARAEHISDPSFEAAIRQAVEWLDHNQRPDKAAFEDANQRLLPLLQQQLKRAQASEKRLIEAMQGRERMATAKNIASEALESQIKDQSLSSSFQALLRNAWLDALTLALLRYGAPSHGWSTQLTRTEQILAILRESKPISSPDLAHEVESALRRVGYHDDDARAVAQLLSRSPATPAESGTPPTEEIARRIQAHTRFGADDSHEPSPPPDTHTARNEQENACYQQLCTLPFGTWFDFISDEKGETSRRRLSWYSKITEHALFVNRRGQKTDVIHLDTLAKMMAAKKVRLTDCNQIRLVDRALSSIVNALQQRLRGNNAAQATLSA